MAAVRRAPSKALGVTAAEKALETARLEDPRHLAGLAVLFPLCGAARLVLPSQHRLSSLAAFRAHLLERFPPPDCLHPEKQAGAGGREQAGEEGGEEGGDQAGEDIGEEGEEMRALGCSSRAHLERPYYDPTRLRLYTMLQPWLEKRDHKLETHAASPSFDCDVGIWPAAGREWYYLQEVRSEADWAAYLCSRGRCSFGTSSCGVVVVAPHAACMWPLTEQIYGGWAGGCGPSSMACDQHPLEGWAREAADDEGSKERGVVVGAAAEGAGGDQEEADVVTVEVRRWRARSGVQLMVGAGHLAWSEACAALRPYLYGEREANSAPAVSVVEDEGHRALLDEAIPMGLWFRPNRDMYWVRVDDEEGWAAVLQWARRVGGGIVRLCADETEGDRHGERTWWAHGSRQKGCSCCFLPLIRVKNLDREYRAEALALFRVERQLATALSWAGSLPRPGTVRRFVDLIAPMEEKKGAPLPRSNVKQLCRLLRCWSSTCGELLCAALRSFEAVDSKDLGKPGVTRSMYDLTQAVQDTLRREALRTQASVLGAERQADAGVIERWIWQLLPSQDLVLDVEGRWELFIRGDSEQLLGHVLVAYARFLHARIGHVDGQHAFTEAVHRVLLEAVSNYGYDDVHTLESSFPEAPADAFASLLEQARTNAQKKKAGGN
jgi:hypothetical protein